MLLKLTHTTDLTYTDLISESIMELRMQPRQESDQHRLAFSLQIGPQATVSSYFDWLGNTVHTFSISAFHQQIRIIATSIVETERGRVAPERFRDTWPIAPADLDYSMFDYLSFGGPVIDCPELQDLTSTLDASIAMSLGELALRILHLINEKFVYEKGATSAASPITEILQHGRGVCQDFTHLMIACARALQIPARYVSGLVHPDEERYRGFTQTHAWCELYFPSAGWVGFDPANNCIVGGNFIKVGVGRDFRDVPPNKGIYRGSAKETIDVTVHSEDLPVIPTGMAAERFAPLSIPVYPEGYTGPREFVARHQDQQQQQHKAPEQQQQQQQQ